VGRVFAGVGFGVLEELATQAFVHGFGGYGEHSEIEVIGFVAEEDAGFYGAGFGFTEAEDEGWFGVCEFAFEVFA